MIHAANLSCGYGTSRVLKGVNLQVDPAEFLGIIGPNGSGKTTLLRALSGLLPYSGSITISGKDLQNMKVNERARAIASVPQLFTDGLDMRTESLVLLGRYPHLGFLSGLTTDDYSKADDALNETGTAQFVGRKLCDLSGGELQRVLVAKAIAQETSILMLDEATSNLDVARSIDIFDMLKRLNRNGKTILSVVHDLNLAALYCDRVVVLKNGQIHHEGHVEEVYTAEKLQEIYETKISVIRHPEHDVPQVLYNSHPTLRK